MMTNSLDDIIVEHLDESTFLWLQRRAATNAPNYSPSQFRDLDDRLESHIDGLRVARDSGWTLADAALEGKGPENYFPASVLAAEAADSRMFAIIERVEKLPDAVSGVVSALGWVEPNFLSGRAKSLLDAASPFRQMIGLAACDLHRKDPGPSLGRFIVSSDPRLRTRALRAAGDLGRAELLPELLRGLEDPKRDARYWASRSGVLLGDRRKALRELAALAVTAGQRQTPALRLALQAQDAAAGHELLDELKDVRDGSRLRIIGSGFVGSVRYVPWLVDQMSNPLLARVAGEAFVNITGADFNLDQLEAMPPEGFEEGPTEDPADENVEVPEDVSLPWPDVAKVTSWWQNNRGRFEEATRYLLGAPITRAWCTEILKTGYQRQRILAAQYLCLLEPGTPLFNTSAPAWRQQRLLGRM